MSAFKIFYSWQSDLPGNKTRYFIREAIDKANELARETETVEAERDEATKGLTGSPDIVQSIFAKINECDLFIADVSPCYKLEIDGNAEKKEKKSPNPNALIELGYEEALADFVALASDVNRYEFEISSLRPNECKWLTPGILIKPATNGKIGIHYRISSSKSTGRIEGRLELNE